MQPRLEELIPTSDTELRTETSEENTKYIKSCIGTYLENKILFQIEILQTAGIPEDKWTLFLIGKTNNNLSVQMGTYYCLNLCPSRANCKSAEEKGWINTNINYPAAFLGKVYVVPERGNPQKTYILHQIH